MNKADPKSLFILFLVITAALIGALSLRRSMLSDREAQVGAFPAPDTFSTDIVYNGADTLEDLGRDICNPDLWYPALVQDSEVFFYVMQGGDPAHIMGAQRFAAPSDAIAMEYCKPESAHISECGEVFPAIASRLRDDALTEQAMLDAQSALGVQGCGILRMTMTLNRRGEAMISHHVVAGLINDRWRVLLFLPSAM